MRFLRNGSVLSLTTLVLVATPATAQPQPDPTIESLVAQATARLAAVQVPGAGPQVDLTLDDAVARALERNLDLAVQRLSPQVFDLTLAQQRSAYLPTLNSNLSSSSRTNPSSTQLDGGESIVSDTAVYNGGTAATDAHVAWLWRVLAEDFTPQERVAFLRFVSGRSR